MHCNHNDVFKFSIQTNSHALNSLNQQVNAYNPNLDDEYVKFLSIHMTRLGLKSHCTCNFTTLKGSTSKP